MAFDRHSLILTLPPLVLSLLAQWHVRSTFHRFAKVKVRSGCSGAEAAQAVLATAGVQGVRIEHHQGFLSDHYDPLSKTLRLSPSVFDGHSISAIAVAAHEAGHAIQDKVGYRPLAWRSLLVPLCQLGNMLWFWPFLAGISLRQLSFAPVLLWMGIGLLVAVVLVQLLTLPTEFNASSQAKAVLVSSGIVSNREEVAWVKRLLNTAALTHLAAVVAIVPRLPRLVLRQFRH